MTRIFISALCLLSLSPKTHAMLWALPIEIPLGIQCYIQSTTKKLMQKTPETYKGAVEMSILLVAGAGLALAFASSDKADTATPDNKKESAVSRVYDSLSNLLSFETLETAGLVLGGVSFFVSRRDIHALGE